ncbi:YIPF1 protein, partial [Amia calva]|nr:YIPF1 protein [Amia calva]
MIDAALNSSGAQVILATSNDENYPPENIIDGSSETFWVSTGMFPQEFIIRFSNPVKVSLVTLQCYNVKHLKIEKSASNEAADFEAVIEKGPFWICATLVFAIAISGNISSFLVHLGQPDYHYVPEFRKVTIAATAIYSYAWLVPLALWGFLMWRNSKVMNIVSYSFLEIVCVYGYSLFIYIPAAVLWIIPDESVRWVSIVIAMCLSGSVLVMTFWPAVRDDHRRIAIATVSTIVVLHALLAVGCKVWGVVFILYRSLTLKCLSLLKKREEKSVGIYSGLDFLTQH